MYPIHILIKVVTVNPSWTTSAVNSFQNGLGEQLLCTLIRFTSETFLVWGGSVLRNESWRMTLFGSSRPHRLDYKWYKGQSSDKVSQW